MISHAGCNLKRLFFPVLLSLYLSGFVSAQISGLPTDGTDSNFGGTTAIAGTVLTPSGQRIETRIRVRLVSMTRGDISTNTDDRGNFSFRGVSSGSYTIVIDKEKEYAPVAQDVNVTQLRGSPPQTYNLNIRLSFKAKTEAKPGVVDSQFADVPKSAVDFFTKAIELAKKSDHKEAVAQLRLAISEYPKFMMAFNELGIQYLRLNEIKKADESFQTALEINPEAFSPLLNRGILLAHLKQFEKAETVLRNALKIKDQSAAAHYYLGQVLANLGRFDEAEQRFLSAVSLGGDEMREAHRYLAIIYGARQDKKKAAAELETYLRLVPTAPDAEQLRKVLKQYKGLDKTSGVPASQTRP